MFEIVQSMKDDTLTVCPECGGTLRKIFAPPAIAFKGSGFYATDHGKKAERPAKAEPEGSKSDKSQDGKKAEKKGEKGTDTKGEKKSEKKSETSGGTDRTEASKS